MGSEGSWEPQFEPEVPEEGVAGRWTEDHRADVGTEGEVGMDRAIEEQDERNIRCETVSRLIVS
jgi:hypothetical protein